MSFGLLQKLENAHSEGIWCCKWGSFDKDLLLVTGSKDESVTIWDFKSEKDNDEIKSPQLGQRHQYTGHRLGVISVDVLWAEDVPPDDQQQLLESLNVQDSVVQAESNSRFMVASNSLDSCVRIWELSSNKTKALIENGQSESWQVCFHPQYYKSVKSSHRSYDPNKSIIAVGGGTSQSINLFNVETKKRMAQLKLPLEHEKEASKKAIRDQYVLSVAFSQDGNVVACGCMDGSIYVFDLQQQQIVQQIKDHHKPVRTLKFSPANYLMSGSDDMHIHIHDEHGELIDSFSGHESWILDLAWHPDGRSFVSASADSKAKIWNFEQRTVMQSLNNHRDMVWGVDFDHTGKHIATVSDDKSICIYGTA